MEGVAARITLKADRRLRLAGLLHASAVLAVTPAAATIAALWMSRHGFSAVDLTILVVAHLLGFLGVAVALHRYFSHRAFETGPRTRAALAILAMTAGQGSVLFWVSDHRRHHRFSDQPGDPHSPNLPPGSLFARLIRAHMGWMLRHDFANPVLFAPDLVADRGLARLNRLYPFWVLIGLAAPAAVGAIAGQVLSGAAFTGAMDGFVWGGIVRLATVQHMTFAVNSFGHRWGRRRYLTRDGSRNLAILALPTLGDSFHNNHHAHPASARMGHDPWDLDLAWLFIRCLAALGLAHTVREIDPLAQQRVGLVRTEDL